MVVQLLLLLAVVVRDYVKIIVNFLSQKLTS